MVKLAAVLFLVLLLTACGKNDVTANAVQQPTVTVADEPADEADVVVDEPVPEPEAPAPEPEAAPIPSPTPPDEQAPVESTGLTLTITARLNSPQGMTKVVVIDGSSDPPTTEQYIFPTTNRDTVISRTATRIGATDTEVEDLITFEGEAAPSRSRK